MRQRVKYAQVVLIVADDVADFEVREVLVVHVSIKLLIVAPKLHGDLLMVHDRFRARVLFLILFRDEGDLLIMLVEYVEVLDLGDEALGAADLRIVLLMCGCASLLSLAIDLES